MTNFKSPSGRASARTERTRAARDRAFAGIFPVPRTPWYSRICALRCVQGPNRKRCHDKCDVECHHLRPVDLKGTLRCDLGAMRDLIGRPL